MAEDQIGALTEHELTVETSGPIVAWAWAGIHYEPQLEVVAVSTCSCARWGSRTQAPLRDRQQLLEAIARVHRDHSSGADQATGWPW